jgi:hypothetical protein
LRFLLSAARFIAYTNLWISFAGGMMTLAFYYCVDLEPNYFVVAFVFFATLFTYNFHRLYKIMFHLPAEGERIDWMKLNLSLSIGAMVLGAAVSLFVGFGFHWRTLGLLAIVGVASFFYMVPLLFKRGTNLRDMPHLKAYLIALVWAASTVILPATESDILFEERTLQMMASNFLFILALTIPFDIRDLPLDEETKKTIPQLLGIKVSKFVSMLLFCLSVFLIADEMGLIIALSCSGLIYAILLIFATPGRKELYFSFLIDGVLILHPLLIIFSNRLAG